MNDFYLICKTHIEILTFNNQLLEKKIFPKELNADASVFVLPDKQILFWSCVTPGKVQKYNTLTYEIHTYKFLYSENIFDILLFGDKILFVTQNKEFILCQ